MAFNFSKITPPISKYLDSDYVDIRRNIAGNLTEIYSNIPCHIAYSNSDNPDPATAEQKPIIQSITVHFENWVDVKNDDYLVCKKTDYSGIVLAVYSGRCGNPVVSMARKKVSMAMSAGSAAEATPIPPKDYITVTVFYITAGDVLKTADEVKVEKNSSFTIQAAEIEGYKTMGCYIDGEYSDSDTAYIPDVGDVDHKIEFLYEEQQGAEYLRFLVNSMYTKDDGSLASGWHLYKKIPIQEMQQEGAAYLITADDLTFSHEETYKKHSIAAGVDLVIMPGREYITVTGIVSRSAGLVTFRAEEFFPSQAQLDAYIAGVYE